MAPESPAQYTARILGYLDTKDPLEVLESTPAALTKLVSTSDEAALSVPPAPGKWSAREILAHLADTEVVLGYRVRRILESDGVAIDAYDQNRWAAIGNYAQIPTRDSLDRLRTLRAGNLRLLRSLSSAQLAHTGVHAERGPESIGHIMRLWAGHDLNHRGQVERIVTRKAL
jgi:uncharacterized damage-inducible protein DinB